MYEIVQAYDRCIHEVQVGTVSNHLIISRPLAHFDYENMASYMPPLAAAKHAEDYKILKLKYMLPFIQCQCFDRRKGAYLVEKNQRFIKIRALFWPDISGCISMSYKA